MFVGGVSKELCSILSKVCFIYALNLTITLQVSSKAFKLVASLLKVDVNAQLASGIVATSVLRSLRFPPLI